jgi:hypothetical protein
MKLKNLKKKIRQLEKRLREGPKKLAKLKRKLQTAEAKKKTAVRADGSAKKPAKTQGKKPGDKAKAQTRTAGAKDQSAPMKVKKKLNLSPERRAALSAAMKARWVAKRAAAGANSPTVSPDQGFTVAESVWD